MEYSERNKLYYLKELYKHITFYNLMAPFPVYDTEYVDNVNKEIEKMKYTKEEYNSEPVEFCSHCKSLHVENDSEGNILCRRCGSINETTTLNSISEYNKKYEKIWE